MDLAEDVKSAFSSQASILGKILRDVKEIISGQASGTDEYQEIYQDTLNQTMECYKKISPSPKNI